MREENGDSPKNARIKIDYSKKKPKVTFSYPSKDHQVEGSMVGLILVGWIIINFPLVLYLSITSSLEPPIQESYLNEVNKSNYNFSDYTDFLRYINDTNLINNIFSKINNPSNKTDTILENLKQLIRPLLVLSYLFLIPILIIYLPFKKRWQRLYPLVQGKIAKKKITILTSKDIREENKKYYCELPIFENIILDYNATKDFSKYLELFEIREHKFKYYISKKRKKRILKRKNGKKELKKEELNEWLWYARFYFKQKPKKGKITILYR